MMKKTLYIALVLSFVYQFFGFFIAFKIEQSQITKQIEQQIELIKTDDGLVIFTVSEDNLESFYWTKPEREFRHKGEMYDVVKKEVSGENTIYFCIHDVRESKLYTSLEKHVDDFLQNKSNAYNKKVNVFKLLLQDCLIQNYFICEALAFSTLAFSQTSNNYSSIISHIESPPPKYSC